MGKLLKKRRRKNKKKYSLKDDVQLMTKQGLRIKKLALWIKEDPALLYEHMYLPGIEKNRYCKISITDVAFRSFKKSLIQKCRKCFDNMVKRQILIRERKKKEETKKKKINS